MNHKFKGTGVAIVTPFLANKEIDFNGLSQLVEYLITGGVNFIVSLGTTGESATLSFQEQKKIVQHTLSVVNNRIPVMVGCGGNNTISVAKNMLEMETWGNFDCFLSVSPYYNKPSQEGIYQHFKYLAEHTNKNILLYNVPGRTAKNMEVETVVRLANDFGNIIGVKEAGNSLEQSKRLVQAVPNNFVLLSGDDDLIVQQMKFGFHGVISVVANAYPKQWSEVISTMLHKEVERPKLVFDSLFEFTNLIFEENNPAGIKCALDEMGFIKQNARLPIVPVCSDLEVRIRNFVANYNPLPKQ